MTWRRHAASCALAVPGGTREWVPADTATGWAGDELACTCSARRTKPLRRTRIKPSRKAAQRRRAESKVVQVVRPIVEDRDGYCRLMWFDDATRRQIATIFGSCSGPSQWSHYNATHRRSKTMGQAPEERHDRRHSLMLCAFHSAEYDQNRMAIVKLDEGRGCDGRLRFKRGGDVWDEPNGS